MAQTSPPLPNHVQNGGGSLRQYLMLAHLYKRRQDIQYWLILHVLSELHEGN